MIVKTEEQSETWSKSVLWPKNISTYFSTAYISRTKTDYFLNSSLFSYFQSDGHRTKWTFIDDENE